METSVITNPEWRPTVTEVEGRFVHASNATLLGETSDGTAVIYKPIAGARPLWDFDAASLAIREVWTYRIDAALGLGLVPETVIGDGVYGLGAVQRFVTGSADDRVIEMVNACDEALWPVAVLDLVINNADRKAGHILLDADATMWAIDHGLTFHEHAKLRTVLWGFAGSTIPPQFMESLGRLERAIHKELGAEFADSFSTNELAALQTRVASLIATGRHPDPPHDRPAMPWPPY